MKNLGNATLILFLGLTFCSQSFANIVKEGFFIQDPKGVYLAQLNRQGEFTVDHRSTQGYELYGDEGTAEFLENQHIPFNQIEEEMFKALGEKSGYPAPEEIGRQLQQIVAQNSEIMRLFSIGKSVEGRDLWVVKISNRPEQDQKKPEFKYIANMHGDEIVGREMMVKLIDDLGKGYHQGDEQINKLVNNSEIYIMPSMNPDGALKRQRGNSRYVDLNRNFPDFSTSDNQNGPNGRAPETQAVMGFQKDHNFGLSANFHGGAEVVNYPWDTIAEAHPLEKLVMDLSLHYAESVPYIRDSREFDRGIVNGYAWYEVNGGMQDWSYYWYGDLQVTIELSGTKWPDYSKVSYYYNENRQALLDMIQDVQQGVGFYFSDATQAGQINLTDEQGKKWGPYSFDKGEFYRVLPQGNYQVSITRQNRPEITKMVRVSPADQFEAGYYLID